MKTRVLKKWISNFITTSLCVLLLIMICAVILSKTSGGKPNFFGYQLLTVQSGSMEPAIKTGSIIAVKPGGDMARFKKGEIITFKTNDDLIVTHRIVDKIKNGNQVSYRTKGDNNQTSDLNLVSSNNVLAEYKHFTIPFIGYIATFSKSKNGMAIILFLLGLVLLIGSIIFVWNTLAKDNKRRIANEMNLEDRLKKNGGIQNKNFSLPKKL
ncbi:signal peptidase I SipW [Neobacillus citreus]|uniref:Signal peptidase I n=1 Tax=Neobacillus citreus TaxID=2833578 RepID=A0A942T3B2_9BACI|nr:signal peptidase I [Neobacillus citreus]MCH6268099.1 signal peptidase I [Neobacillus citreus]